MMVQLYNEVMIYKNIILNPKSIFKKTIKIYLKVYKIFLILKYNF